ncbi:hypothetical protein GWR56_09145 [Mucilaginibacter sp. 14171R-50]|uniref:hypothetical protein n=1 Tax=Mucilaginibacter sp. 14171R-50 TaxID=2703789 RepID=UPI00138C5723|nr:hypothetical protein [Mucilaginibacter sp. 14171R-50]QHS55695.1 hypothetical protein GWR56_09145 [Mucilaginibacter sp. 14171R-50]
MNTAGKHYKFINSRTGNVIFYSSLSADLSPEEIKAELDKIRTQVAIKNGIYRETIYWEEIKDE